VHGPRASRPQLPEAVAEAPSDVAIQALSILFKLAPDVNLQLDALSSATSALPTNAACTDELQPELLRCLKQARCVCFCLGCGTNSPVCQQCKPCGMHEVEPL
jgi:hypothetical protein